MARTSNRGGGRKNSGGKAWAKARETTANDSDFGESMPINEEGRFIVQLIQGGVHKTSKGNQLIRKWIVIDHDDWEGTICTDFEGPLDEEDRMVWVQRGLASLGVDIDDIGVDESSTQKQVEAAISKVYEELVEEAVCASMSIKENDGYYNMRIGKARNVDEDLLYDPKEALKGGGKPASDDKGGDDEGEGEGEDDWAEGDIVAFKKGRKKVEGPIVSFTDDDEAVVDIDGDEITVALDKLELIEAAPEGDDEGVEDEGGADEGEGSEVTWDDLEVDDKVMVDFGEDGEYPGTVTSKPRGSKGKGTVQVTFDDPEDPGPEMIEVTSIRKLDGDAPDDVLGLSFEKGDDVQFKEGRKTVTGVVQSVTDDTVKVKVKGKRAAVAVDIDKVSHVTA